MATKRNTTPPKQQDSYIDPDLAGDDNETTKPTPSTEHIQNLKEGYDTFPIPTTSAGKGKKYCKNCNAVMGARSVDCSNCGFHIYKDGESQAQSSKAPRAVRQQAPTESTRIDPYAVYKVLRGRGFELSVTADILNPNAKPEVKAEKVIQPVIDFLNVSETVSSSPKLKFAIDLDGLLAFLKIPERK